jgi:hypothetical protein
LELQQIDCYIQPDGRVRLEVHGVAGQGCLALTAALEAALGAEVEERTLTPEALDGPAAANGSAQTLGLR